MPWFGKPSVQESLRKAFLSTSMRKRFDAKLALVEACKALGGITPDNTPGDPVTELMQQLSDCILYNELCDVYSTLTKTDEQNARLWKLLGLACYWNAFRWSGLMYCDPAVSAFQKALQCPNREAAYTPLRLAEWVLKASFLKSYTHRDDAACETLLKTYNSVRIDGYRQFGTAVGEVTSQELWGAIEEECQSRRAADEKDAGRAFYNTITKRLFNVNLGDVWKGELGTFTVWNINITGRDNGSVFLIRTSPRQDGDLLVNFRETTESRYELVSS